MDGPRAYFWGIWGAIGAMSKEHQRKHWFSPCVVQIDNARCFGKDTFLSNRFAISSGSTRRIWWTKIKNGPILAKSSLKKSMKTADKNNWPGEQRGCLEQVFWMFTTIKIARTWNLQLNTVSNLHNSRKSQYLLGLSYESGSRLCYCKL